MKNQKGKPTVYKGPTKVQMMQELETSKPVQEYLQHFNEIAAQSFMDHYLKLKYQWFTHADVAVKENQNNLLQWMDTAFLHLEFILQKKLFDAQCLWRAEEVTYKEIEICYDFRIWEHDIFNCPFISPITEEDITQYIAFLQTENADPTTFVNGYWQDHKEIKAAYNNSSNKRNFPDWYEFVNNQNSMNLLLLLPNTRETKEDFYMDLHKVETSLQTSEKENRQLNNADNRPWINFYDDKIIKNFVAKYESKAVQSIYKEFRFLHRNDEKTKYINSLTEALMSADELIPVEANTNWYKALEQALKTHQTKKLIDALPVAWEQYNMNIEMGIAFSKKNIAIHTHIRSIYATGILNGRVLNGEEENFNF